MSVKPIVGIYPMPPVNGGIVPPWLQKPVPKPPKETKR